MTDDFDPTENGKEIFTEDQFQEIPVDSKATVRKGIEHSFESPTDKGAELIDNSIDAHANNCIFAASKKVKDIGQKDDGFGIKKVRDLVTWGSDHKIDEQRVEDNPDSTGMFGEGAKSMLSICDKMQFYSNNGTKEFTIELERKPKRPLPLDFPRFASDEKDSEKNKPLGTTVRARNLDIDDIEDIRKNAKDNWGTKFAWIIAKGFNQRMHFIDENGVKTENYQLEIADRLKPLFEGFPSNIKNIGILYDKNLDRDVRIEAIAIAGVRPVDRKIFYARKHRIITEKLTKRDVMMIVNFDSTKILRDRRGFDHKDPLTKQYLQLVEDYVDGNFEEAKSWDALNDRQRNEHMKMLDLLNDLAEQFGLFKKDQKPKVEEIPIRVTVDPTQTNINGFLKTSRKQFPAVLKPSTELLSKVRTKRTKRGGKGHKGTKNPSVKIRTVLVHKTKLVEGKEYHAIGVNIEDNNKHVYETYFDFASREFIEDPTRMVDIDKKPNKCTIWFNELTNYFKSKMPKIDTTKSESNKSKFELEEMLPLIAMGVTEAFFGDKDYPQKLYQMKYDEMLNIVSSLYVQGNKSEKEEKKKRRNN